MGPKEVFRLAERQGIKNLLEPEARRVLEHYKIPLPEWKFIKTVEEAKEFARKFGYPLVLKIVSKDIIHKSDVGGVIVNIKSEQELEKAVEKISTNVKKKAPKARIDGLLIQKMVEEGLEIIIGGKTDEQFGQTIAFGLGGIFTEVFEDVSFRIVPIARNDAEDMIREIKGYKILKGYRGKSYDVGALVEILLKTSRLLEENQEIRELDINPVIALSKGAVAVDARIIID